MNLQDLIPIGVTLVVIAIVLAMGANILDKVQAGQTAGSYAYNITEEGLKGVNELGSWQTTIAIVVVAAIIIGIVLTAFLLGRNR